MMITRKAVPGDLDDLAELFDQYRVFYECTSDKPAALRFLSERMERRESEIFIVDTGERLAGFVQLYPIFSSVRMKRLWLLNDLYVHPAFRGQGLSKIMIDRAKLLARDTNASGLMLETARTNVIGNNLYPATGFVLDNDHCYYFWNSAQ